LRLLLARGVASSDRRISRLVGGAQASLGLVEPGVHFRQRFAQALSLETPRQDRALAHEASARDRAPAGDLLAVERYDRVA
jgi:hypothetical protein